MQITHKITRNATLKYGNREKYSKVEFPLYRKPNIWFESNEINVKSYTKNAVDLQYLILKCWIFCKVENPV